jgi:hypothetical protein
MVSEKRPVEDKQLEKRLCELEDGLEFWRNKCSEFPKMCGFSEEEVGGHYNHVTNTLLQIYLANVPLAKESFCEDNDFNQGKQDLLEAVHIDNLLFTYFQLLEEFPGFREGEMICEDCFFPQLREETYSIDFYIAESFRLLELVYDPSRLSIKVSGIDSDYFNEFPLFDSSLTKLVDKCKNGDFCTYSERFRPNSLTMALTKPEVVEKMDQLGEEIKEAALEGDIDLVQEIRDQMYEMDKPK